MLRESQRKKAKRYEALCHFVTLCQLGRGEGWAGRIPQCLADPVEGTEDVEGAACRVGVQRRKKYSLRWKRKYSSDQIIIIIAQG